MLTLQQRREAKAANRLRRSLRAATLPELCARVDGLECADAVDCLNALPRRRAAELFAQLRPEQAVTLLQATELQRIGALLAALPVGQAAALLDRVADDRAAAIVGALDPALRGRLLPLLDSQRRVTVDLLLSYPPHTAGALMTTDFVSIDAGATVAEALERVRQGDRSRETVYAVHLLDAATGQLVQMVPLSRLIGAEPDAPVRSLAPETSPVTADAQMDQEDVARLIRRHDLLAIPVVDNTMHMLGIVTVDDVLDALIAESTRDAQKFGGMEALDKPYMEIGFLAMMRKRAGWLSVLFLGEMLTASAMQHYEDSLAQAVVLTLFIPLVMSSGGNSGSQATSLLIRALALQELRLSDWWKVALRELPTGVVLGSILGVLAIIRITIWQLAGFHDYGEHWMLVAATIAAALVGIVGFGSVSGSMLPFALKRLGFDPASASAPFVATLVDVTGLVIYFSIAAWILRGTVL